MVSTFWSFARKCNEKFTEMFSGSPSFDTQTSDVNLWELITVRKNCSFSFSLSLSLSLSLSRARARARQRKPDRIAEKPSEPTWMKCVCVRERESVWMCVCEFAWQTGWLGKPPSVKIACLFKRKFQEPKKLRCHCQQYNDTHTNDFLLFCPGTWGCSFSACNTFWMCSSFGLLLNLCRCRLSLC